MAHRIAPHQWLSALALLLGLWPFSCAGPHCNGSEPISPADKGRCAGKEAHRAEKRACAPHAPRDAVCSSSYPTNNCTVDADCVERANGFCEGPRAMMAGGCNCDYGCIRDADCGPGRICECGDSGGLCVSASCASDADCESGLCLAVWTAECIVASKVYTCVTSKDECTNSSDCGDGDCRWASTRRRCMSRSECGAGI